MFHNQAIKLKTVRIANPIYDAVFKYLLDDNKVAKLFLSAILGEEVLNLEPRAREHVMELEKRSLTVYHLDFAARIATAGGSKLVIIEIQKAKFAADLMRFRRYLGEQYRNEENKHTEGGKERPLPIISMYFLGYPLNHVKAPVVKVNRQYLDLLSGEVLDEREPFIESLTHDSYVIQIPFLGRRRQSDLEKLLSVFDQRSVDSRESGDSHILNVSPEHFPERYQVIIRRLQMAAEEQKVRETMTVEDGILGEFQEYERSIERLEQAVQEKDRAFQEPQQALREKDEALREAQALIEKLTAKPQ